MSWIDHINEAMVRLINRQATVSADETGLVSNGERYPYTDLERAVAYSQPNAVGDDFAVLLDFGNERLICVSRDDAAWEAVTRALDAHPRNQSRHVEWSLRLVADPTTQLELLSRR